MSSAEPRPVSPPVSVEALIKAARSLGGMTVGELGDTLGVQVPLDQRRAKGLVGNLLERALGATAGSKSLPDFPELGVELKSIPVNAAGRPQESTFVCTIPLADVADTEWAQSRVAAKLARVLFVPVESVKGLPLPQRRIGYAMLWIPSAEEASLLRADWYEMAGYIGRGDADQITGHMGQCLQIRPKGQNGADLKKAPESEGAWQLTMGRGFYLRAGFTKAVLARLRTEA